MHARLASVQLRNVSRRQIPINVRSVQHNVLEFIASAGLQGARIPESARVLFGYLLGATGYKAFTWDELVAELKADRPTANPLLSKVKIGPCRRPGRRELAMVAIVTFVNEWNEFTVALTMLRSPAKQTITLRVVNLVAGRYTVEWNQVMAATVVATVPVALLFAWLQRYLVGGLTLGAVK